MNLWESCYARLHSARMEPAWPEPPKFPRWGEGEAVFAAADKFDLHSAISAQVDALDEGSANIDVVITETDYGEANRAAARAAIATSGLEAIAFYAPIHANGAEHWGIFINEPIFFGTCAAAMSRLGANSRSNHTRTGVSQLDQSFLTAWSTSSPSVPEFEVAREAALGTHWRLRDGSFANGR
jgi:hypothetical protein